MSVLKSKTGNSTFIYDRGYNYNHILKEYLNNKETLLPVSQHNLNYIREYNKLLTRNSLLGRKFSFIQKFISLSKVLEHDDIARYSHNIYGILSSLNKQRGLICAIRHKLLEYRIDEKKLLNALKYNINRLEQRLNFLENEILCSYLQFTEYYSYVLYLESNGLSFSSDLDIYVSKCSDTDSSEDKLNVLNEACLNYIDYVNNFMLEHNLVDDSYERREKYKLFLEKKYKSYENDEKEAEKEKLQYCDYILDGFRANIIDCINNGNSNNFISKKKFEAFRNKLNSFYSNNKNPFYLIIYTSIKNNGKVLNLTVNNLNGYGSSNFTEAYLFSDNHSYEMAINRLSNQKCCKYDILEIYPENGYLLAH